MRLASATAGSVMEIRYLLSCDYSAASAEIAVIVPFDAMLCSAN
jgi:hypothetical protein